MLQFHFVVAPQIGHSQCVMPCTGTMTNVPKNMGWLWTADNIPALKVGLTYLIKVLPFCYIFSSFFIYFFIL